MFRIAFVSVILLPFSLFLACDGREAVEDIPRIVLHGGYYELRLPEALELEIRRQFRSYVPPEKQDFADDLQSLFSVERLPYAAWGDFNGDGLTDVVLILKEENEDRSESVQRVKLISFHQTKEGQYDPHVLRDMTGPGPPFYIYVQSQPRGEVTYMLQDSSDSSILQTDVLHLQTEGIRFGFYGKASSLFYWAEEEYKVLVTGD